MTQTSFNVSTADGGHEGRVTKGSLGEVEFSTFQLGDMMAVAGLYLSTQYNPHRNFKRAYLNK